MKRCCLCLLLTLALLLGCAPALAEIDPSKPMLALTFDDGPSEYTEQILELLSEYGCHATFFTVGNRVNAHADTVRAAVEAGNEIGTHSWSHRRLSDLTAEAVAQDLTQCVEALGSIIEQPIRFARPPYGAIGKSVFAGLHSAGLVGVNWSVDSLDWSLRDAPRICSGVMQEVFSGAIILMHDTYPETVEALQTLLPQLTEAGYQVLTVGELMSFYDGELRTGEVYTRLRSHILDE